MTSLKELLDVVPAAAGLAPTLPDRHVGVPVLRGSQRQGDVWVWAVAVLGREPLGAGRALGHDGVTVVGMAGGNQHRLVGDGLWAPAGGAAVSDGDLGTLMVPPGGTAYLEHVGPGAHHGALGIGPGEYLLRRQTVEALPDPEELARERYVAGGERRAAKARRKAERAAARERRAEARAEVRQATALAQASVVPVAPQRVVVETVVVERMAPRAPRPAREPRVRPEPRARAAAPARVERVRPERAPKPARVPRVRPVRQRAERKAKPVRQPKARVERKATPVRAPKARVERKATPVRAPKARAVRQPAAPKLVRPKPAPDTSRAQIAASRAAIAASNAQVREINRRIHAD